MDVRHTMAAEPLAAEAVAAARQGARVLVIRNTVKAVVTAYKAAAHAAGHDDLLLSVAGAPALHHSRFAPEDRARLDQAAETALEPDPGRTVQGRDCDWHADP